MGKEHLLLLQRTRVWFLTPTQVSSQPHLTPDPDNLILSDSQVTYTYTHTHTTGTHSSTYTHTQACTHTGTHISTHMHTRAHTQAHVSKHAHARTHTYIIFTCLSAHLTEGHCHIQLPSTLSQKKIYRDI